MPEVLFVLSDLKQKFRQFDQIAQIAARLQVVLGTINTQNAEFAGRSDQIARAYHTQIDQPTSDLVKLVTGMQQLFELTGGTGGDAVNDFDRADTDATHAANSW